MKESDDRAMELLLRRHAQANPRVSNGQGTSGEALSAHLEADEFNALAENALPQAARARYFSHLADCASCRKLATDLAITAAAAAGKERELVPGKSAQGAFWQMLATLFSLPVMRYGVPALTILILVVVGFVALRRPTAELVAQRESTLERQDRPSITATPAAPTESTSAPGQKPDNGQIKANTPVAAGKELSKAQPAVAIEKSATSGYAGAANIQQQPGYALEPNATPSEMFKNAPTTAAPQAPARAEARDNLKAAAGGVLADGVSAKKVETIQSKDEQITSREVRALPAPKFGGLASENKEKGGPRRSRAQSETERGRADSPSSRSTSDTSDQTRNVGGHKFRREGNVWIDAAYDSSRETTTLSRGSDQYRKLVDDKPGLRAIVDELNNVVVVWNGKQYRIH